jgi:hypothetical protein
MSAKTAIQSVAWPKAASTTNTIRQQRERDVHPDDPLRLAGDPDRGH